MTSETTLREYIVTLHQFDDLESFYADMETHSGSLYIPNRPVECCLRRPVSRNTHYMLSDQEAEQLYQDSRVLAVELTLEARGIEIRPAWTQTSSLWSKSDTLATGQLNWGLLRVTEGQQRPNWGSAATAEVTGTATAPFSGKNVDVLIMDGRLEIDHPEFAKNSDGTGGSRIKQYNWYALNPRVTGGAAGTYSYTPADIDSDYHGTFCAAIVAGNTQGWARDADIYSIYVYGVAPIVTSSFQFDYAKVWHQSKSINAATGQKNPTVMNCSFTLATATTVSTTITSLVYQGTTYNGPFTDAQLRSYGVEVYNGTVYLPSRSASFEADVADCIAAGIIIVAAAGNDSFKVVLPGSADYNNTITYDSALGTQTNFYQRGSVPAAVPNVISVGAIGAAGNFIGEEKADYSNCGPRIDIFAPGSRIRSAVNNNWKSIANTVADTRSSSYKIYQANGTSFASPQVTGVLATMLEVTPLLTPSAALSYITSNAKTGQMYDSNAINYYFALQGAPNRYLFAAYPTSMSITPNTTTATPLQNITYTITMTGAADGSLVYLTESGTSIGTDFVDGVTQIALTIYSGAASLIRTVRAGITGLRTSALQLRTGGYNGNIQATANTVIVSAGDFASSSGSFIVNSNSGSFSISPTADLTTEGAETFTVSIRTGSIDGPAVFTSGLITINDTSVTP